MRAWRIVRAPHLPAAFSGEGARLFGGRWNPVGVPVVYCSGSLALAALEILVHAGRESLPRDYRAVPVDIPETMEIERIEPTALPKDWRAYPAPLRLQALGERWVRAARTAVLRVPSAVIPEESNLLLNPAHPDFAGLRIGDPRPFSFDLRLTRP